MLESVATSGNAALRERANSVLLAFAERCATELLPGFSDLQRARDKRELRAQPDSMRELDQTILWAEIAELKGKLEYAERVARDWRTKAKDLEKIIEDEAGITEGSDAILCSGPEARRRLKKRLQYHRMQSLGDSQSTLTDEQVQGGIPLNFNPADVPNGMNAPAGCGPFATMTDSQQTGECPLTTGENASTAPLALEEQIDNVASQAADAMRLVFQSLLTLLRTFGH
jgi:hypothetical protein